MKAKTHKAGKHAQANNNPATSPGVSPRRLFGLPKWLVILLVVGVVAGVSFAAFELLLPARIPPELVGEWRVVEGPLKGMTLEFKRNGAMTGRAVIDGKAGEMDGTAEVDGDILRTTTKNPLSGKRETGSQHIVTLTDTDFVTQDDKGTRVVMRRTR
jgi:uncharacterized protein (TIGR03066 family)